MKTLFYKEIVTLFRDKNLLMLSFILITFTGISVLINFINYRSEVKFREEAKKEKRQQWLQQNPKHPHIAAHFGTFAFKPKTLLCFVDPGIDAYAGTYAYMEPHRQNDFIFRPAEGKNASIRLGDFTVTLVLQLVLPLFIIYICYSSFSTEREQGTLKLLVSHGQQLEKIIWSKILACYSIVFALTAIIFLLVLCVVLNSEMCINLPEQFTRILILIITYNLYYFIFTALSVCISALSSFSKNALLLLISVWMGWCIILPKAAANVADSLYTLPADYNFRVNIQNDILMGIDGHNAHDKRSEELKQGLLKKFKVKDVADLPFNFEGYVMQKGEEYSSMVYDKHYSFIQDILKKQNRISEYIGIINPFLAMRNLSMGISGTDMNAHSVFQQSAEEYRRNFVQQMNEDMTEHSRYGDWDYRAGKSLYYSVKEFSYNEPGIGSVMHLYIIDIISLISWVVIMILLVAITAFRIKVV